MTHYTVDYSNLNNDPIAKHNKAIQDIKEYLGDERFKRITDCMRTDCPNMTLEQFTMAASFAGVQGYPVKAWYNYIFGL